MSDVTRSIKEGLAFGPIAGVVFAAAQTVTAAATGDPLVSPLRRSASIVLGPAALGETTPAASVLWIGATVHLVLSAGFGMFYGIYCSALTPETRRRFARQVPLGLLFGAMLWLVNFLFFARLRYPWFLDLPHPPQLLAHAVFYGLPLSLLYAASERRVPRSVQGSTPLSIPR